MFIKWPLPVEDLGKASFPYIVLYHTSTTPEGSHGPYACVMPSGKCTREFPGEEGWSLLMQEEKDIFMPGMSYEEFVEAQ
jgi:hypothetical protein